MGTRKSIGVDVGGSHVSASIIDLQTPGTPQIKRATINAFDEASSILQTIGNTINQTFVEIDEETIDSVGIAFPGPFDYQKGVSNIAFVGGKFESTFGIHVQQALKSSIALSNVPFYFANDAHCFAVGAHHHLQLSCKRSVFLTLGTGFGSAFMEEDCLIHNHVALPAIGAFYNEPFLDAIADDYFSTRWFLKEFTNRTGQEIRSVKELAEAKNQVSASMFNDFGANLGAFLFPWLKEFECEVLVIGGNISNANALFNETLRSELQQLKHLDIIYCNHTEESILTGAALIAEKKCIEEKLTHSINHQELSMDFIPTVRKTTQPILPLTKSSPSHQSYNIFPTFSTQHTVQTGYDSLVQSLLAEKTVIIDGFGGILWDSFRMNMQQCFNGYGKKVLWYDIDSSLKTPDEINEMIAGNLNGDDPIFGKKYLGSLIDFFDQKKLSLLTPDQHADLCIVYGTGAALSNWEGPLVYLDVPKNEIQYRMRAQSITNLGSKEILENSQTYKRFYFVDWPVLNKHKHQLLSKVDYIVDEQRINEVTWMRGDDFRSTLDEMFQQPFRAKPWFEAGVWGGNWMKEKLKDYRRKK